jgi:MYXO-CTERM domain-containing protein
MYSPTSLRLVPIPEAPLPRNLVLVGELHGTTPTLDDVVVRVIDPDRVALTPEATLARCEHERPHTCLVELRLPLLRASSTYDVVITNPETTAIVTLTTGDTIDDTPPTVPDLTPTTRSGLALTDPAERCYNYQSDPVVDGVGASGFGVLRVAVDAIEPVLAAYSDSDGDGSYMLCVPRRELAVLPEDLCFRRTAWDWSGNQGFSAEECVSGPNDTGDDQGGFCSSTSTPTDVPLAGLVALGLVARTRRSRRHSP